MTAADSASIGRTSLKQPFCCLKSTAHYYIPDLPASTPYLLAAIGMPFFFPQFFFIFLLTFYLQTLLLRAIMARGYLAASLAGVVLRAASAALRPLCLARQYSGLYFRMD